MTETEALKEAPVPGGEKAGERGQRGPLRWEALWAVQAKGPQRAGCTGLHWAETWELSACGGA